MFGTARNGLIVVILFVMLWVAVPLILLGALFTSIGCMPLWAINSFAVYAFITSIITLIVSITKKV